MTTDTKTKTVIILAVLTVLVIVGVLVWYYFSVDEETGQTPAQQAAQQAADNAAGTYYTGSTGLAPAGGGAGGGSFSLPLKEIFEGIGKIFKSIVTAIKKAIANAKAKKAAKKAAGNTAQLPPVNPYTTGTNSAPKPPQTTNYPTYDYGSYTLPTDSYSTGGNNTTIEVGHVENAYFMPQK